MQLPMFELDKPQETSVVVVAGALVSRYLPPATRLD